MDSSLHLVPGRYMLPTAPGGSLRKDGPGWEKVENKFTAISGLPACVCVCVCVCRLHICTCVFQCVVCAIKNLTKVLIIKCAVIIPFSLRNMHTVFILTYGYDLSILPVCVCVCVCVCKRERERERERERVHVCESES